MSERGASDSGAPPPEVRDPIAGKLLRRRLAFLVLGVGAALAGSRLLPLVPESRELELELEEPSSILAVELAWARAGASDEAGPAGGTRRVFSKGEAPRRLSFRLSAPDGVYELAITLEREGGTERLTRRLELGDADRVVVHLRRSEP